MQNDLKIAQDTSKRQFGFKRGCSTEAALHKVTHMIERRIAKKGYVLGVLLIIEFPRGSQTKQVGVQK